MTPTGMASCGSRLLDLVEGGDARWRKDLAWYPPMGIAD
jgi:hypothetical protein